MEYIIKDDGDNVIGSINVPEMESEDTLALALRSIEGGVLRIAQVHMTPAKGGFYLGLNWGDAAYVEGEVDETGGPVESEASQSAGGDIALADKPQYELSEDAVQGTGDPNQIVQNNELGLAEQVPDPQKNDEQNKPQRRAR